MSKSRKNVRSVNAANVNAANGVSVANAKLIRELQGLAERRRAILALRENGVNFSEDELDTVDRRMQEINTDLIVPNMGMITDACRKAERSGHVSEDGKQDGAVAVLQGLLKINPDKNRLSTYLTPCIQHEVGEKKTKRQNVIASETMAKNRASIFKAANDLVRRGKTPTDEAVYECLKTYFPEEKLSLRQIKKARGFVPPRWHQSNDFCDLDPEKTQDCSCCWISIAPVMSPPDQATYNELLSAVQRNLSSEDCELFVIYTNCQERLDVTVECYNRDTGAEHDQVEIEARIKAIKTILRKKLAAFSPLAA